MVAVYFLSSKNINYNFFEVLLCIWNFVFVSISINLCKSSFFLFFALYLQLEALETIFNHEKDAVTEGLQSSFQTKL